MTMKCRESRFPLIEEYYHILDQKYPVCKESIGYMKTRNYCNVNETQSMCNDLICNVYRLFLQIFLTYVINACNQMQCVYLYIYIHMDMPIYIYIYIYTYVSVCIHTHKKYVYICIYIHTCIHIYYAVAHFIYNIRMSYSFYIRSNRMPYECYMHFLYTS